MYRTAVTQSKSWQDEPDPDAKQIWFVLRGLIFLIVTAVLYTIPLITRLLSNTKNKLDTVCLFTFYLLLFIVFFSREIQFAKLTPFRFSLFAAFLSFSFLDQWQQLSLLPRVEITVFSKNIKVNVQLETFYYCRDRSLWSFWMGKSATPKMAHIPPLSPTANHRVVTAEPGKL